VTPYEDIELLSENLRSQGKKIVFTNGCFDVLHPGHIYLLKKARELGDYLLVGLNSDESVKRLKGDKRPIFKEEARKEMLLALRFVDNVVVFGEDTPLELIKAIKPDFLVKGAEYAKEEIVGGDFVESYGGKIVRIEMLPEYSTTKLIELLGV